MDRNDRYREAARRKLEPIGLSLVAAGAINPLTVPNGGSVGILNPEGRDGLGSGAFVEVTIYVTAEEAERVPS